MNNFGEYSSENMCENIERQAQRRSRTYFRRDAMWIWKGTGGTQDQIFILKQVIEKAIKTSLIYLRLLTK